MITSILLVCSLALIASVYRYILSDGILNWWFKWGVDYFEKRWFYKPIWGCVYCIAGQMALWVYLINWIASVSSANNVFFAFIFKVIPIYQPSQFTPFLMVLFICATIAVSGLISKIISKWI